MRRATLIGILALWLAPLAAPAQVPGAHPLAEGAGEIQEIDLDAQTLIIDGMRYGITVDVQVEIDGSYGAFTMLEPGMRVHIEFLRISDAERRLTVIRELPDDVELDGV